MVNVPSAKKPARRRTKPASKDYETIISIQENIIKSREHTLGVYEWIVRVLMFKLEARNEEIKYKQGIIQDAYKDRNEAIRRYNALHQLGKFAEDMGVDLTEKLPEHEFNKWKDYEFNIEPKVYESGRTAFTATLKKNLSQQRRDFSRLYKKRKKKK